MVANLGKMMKQFQKMQEDVMRLQEELKNRTVEGTAGGGMVKAVVNGQNEVMTISIQPEAVDPQDVEMLQDMVTAAVNDGLKKAKDLATTEMAKITGGLNLPNIPGLS